MERYAPNANLAGRDVVARSMMTKSLRAVVAVRTVITCTLNLTTLEKR